MNMEFPDLWAVLKLTDLAILTIGGDWGKDADYEDSDFVTALCIRGSEFRNWNENKGSTASIRKIKKASLESRKLIKGDILVEISGGGPEQPVGRTVLIDNTVLAFSKEIPKICTNFLRLLRTTDKIDSGFLNSYLMFFYQSGEIRDYQGGSNNLRNLRFNDYLGIDIPVPPLPEQHRIVAKIEALFSELDKGIECFKTAREQLKIYRQALLKHAFSGKLTGQWRAENQDKLEAAETLIQRIQTEREQRYQQQLKDWETIGKQGSKPKAQKNLPPLTAEELAKLPDLPEGWTWVKSGELFESVTSGSRGWAEYYADSGAIFIRITNLDFDSLKLDLSPKKIQYVQPPVGAEGLRTKVKEGDFLFSITGYLGMFAIAPSLDDAYVNQHISLARPLDGFSKKYFGYYVTSHTGGIHYLNKQTKGAVKAGLGLDDIQNFPVPMCSLNEQIKISCELESRLSEVDQLDQTLTTALQQAEALRQSILKKAFSGQLVPQDPNDESAKVLLERIQAEKATLVTPIRKRNKYA